MHVLYRRIGHQVVHCTLCYLACPFECGTFGKFKLYLEVALILNGEEARRHKPVYEKNQRNHYTECRHNALLVAQCLAYYLDVTVVSGAYPLVDFAEYYVLLLVGRTGLQN